MTKTNAQFYLALGLPILSILIVWLGSTMVNVRAIQALALRIDDLRSEMRAGFDAVNGRLDRLETRFNRIEDEVRKDHENRLARLEAKVFTSAA
jgi:hypothetical protein